MLVRMFRGADGGSLIVTRGSPTIRSYTVVRRQRLKGGGSSVGGEHRMGVRYASGTAYVKSELAANGFMRGSSDGSIKVGLAQLCFPAGVVTCAAASGLLSLVAHCSNGATNDPTNSENYKTTQVPIDTTGIDDAEDSGPDTKYPIPFPMFLLGQVTIGSGLGYSAGYALKTIGKTVAFYVGVTFVSIQYLAYKNIVKTDWNAALRMIEMSLDVDRDGKFGANDARHWWNKLVSLLTYGVPGTGGFMLGFYAGLRS